MARSILITDIAHFVGGPSARALLAEGAHVYGVDASFSDAAARAAFEEKAPGVRALSAQKPEEGEGVRGTARGGIDAVVRDAIERRGRGKEQDLTRLLLLHLRHGGARHREGFEDERLEGFVEVLVGCLVHWAPNGGPGVVVDEHIEAALGLDHPTIFR